nr:hypothetical protein [Actinomycetales bacterium]
MTMLVNEYVHTVAREERKQAAEARRVREAGLNQFHVEDLAVRIEDEADSADTGNGLTAVALVLLNVLLIAAIAVNYAFAPVVAWVLLGAFVLVNLYTVNQLKEMFGTYTLENIEA